MFLYTSGSKLMMQLHNLSKDSKLYFMESRDRPPRQRMDASQVALVLDQLQLQ